MSSEHCAFSFISGFAQWWQTVLLQNISIWAFSSSVVFVSNSAYAWLMVKPGLILYNWMLLWWFHFISCDFSLRFFCLYLNQSLQVQLCGTNLVLLPVRCVYNTCSLQWPNHPSLLLQERLLHHTSCRGRQHRPHLSRDPRYRPLLNKHTTLSGWWWLAGRYLVLNFDEMSTTCSCYKKERTESCSGCVSCWLRGRGVCLLVVWFVCLASMRMVCVWTVM